MCLLLSFSHGMASFIFPVTYSVKFTIISKPKVTQNGPDVILNSCENVTQESQQTEYHKYCQTLLNRWENLFASSMKD